jgi:organic radical activating enzyme
MKKIIKVVQDNQQLMHLTWVINNICPNSCSYCPEVLHNGKNHHYNWDNARKFFKLLFERYPVVHCSVSGGEPSVSPFFKEIVEIFHTSGHTIGLTSNAAKPVRFWNEVSPYINYICFSWHPEFPDEDFIAKVIHASKNTFVTVRVMMHPLYWDKAVEMFYKVKSLPHSFAEPVRIVDWGTKDKTIFNYNEKQLDFFIKESEGYYVDQLHLAHIKPAEILSTYYFNDGTTEQKANANNYVNNGMTDFSGYTCEVGLKTLFISYRGDVYLGNCMIGGPIGNIDDPNNIKWPMSPTICNKKLCHCSSDINVNKFIEL